MSPSWNSVHREGGKEIIGIKCGCGHSFNLEVPEKDVPYITCPECKARIKPEDFGQDFKERTEEYRGKKLHHWAVTIEVEGKVGMIYTKTPTEAKARLRAPIVLASHYPNAEITIKEVRLATEEEVYLALLKDQQ